MRVCFTSDLHGSGRLYEQLEALLRAENPDLLILGGDLFIDGDIEDPLGTQVAYVERDFMPRVATWQTTTPRLIVACIVGNHEWACTWDALQEHHDAGRIVLLDHRRFWEHDGVVFLGHSSTPPTPHIAKDFERLDLPGDPIPDFPGSVWDATAQRTREIDLTEHFRGQPAMSHELAEAPDVSTPWILVAHAPPYESHLDRLASVPHPIGSRAVRRFIETHQPLCSLHGHVHESPRVTGSFSDRLGETLCINPGQDHDRLYAVLFDTQQPAETLRHSVFA